MRSRRLTVGGVCVAAALAAAMPAACGSDDDPQARAQAPKLASAHVVESDPYALACGHVGDQQKWADVTRRATVAIADRERVPGLNRLQATQSLFYAMTELCKGRRASYEPAAAAARAVRQGKFQSDLGTP